MIVHETYVTKDTVEHYLKDQVDFVIDCIDNVEAKVELLYQCVKKSIKVVSSCGAGMKCDPTRIQIGDLSKTRDDQLARKIRKQLKTRGVEKGVTVVFSNEKTDMGLMPLKEHQKENPSKFKVFDNYRLRTVPVMSTMPALIGLSIASHIICELAGHPMSPHEIDDVKFTSY